MKAKYDFLLKCLIIAQHVMDCTSSSGFWIKFFSVSGNPSFSLTSFEISGQSIVWYNELEPISAVFLSM